MVLWRYRYIRVLVVHEGDTDIVDNMDIVDDMPADQHIWYI